MLVAFTEFPAECVFGAIADEEDDVLAVGDVVAEMVEDAAGLGHAGSRDDDSGALHEVEGFGFIDTADEAEAFEAEGVITHEDGVADLLPQILQVQTEDLGGAHRQGAIHVSGDRFEAAFVHELIEFEEKLLSALDGEGGDDDVGSAAAGAVDDVADVVRSVGGVFMFPAAVGGLHDEVIDIATGVGGVEEVIAGAPDIPREEQAEAFFPRIIFDVQDDLSGAEDVTGVDEGQSDAFSDGEGAVIADGDELAEDVFSIDEIITWSEQGLVVALAMFVQPLDVHLMDVGGVRKHDAAQVTGGRGGVDVAVEAVVVQLGKIPTVVDVGVGKDDAVDRFGVKRELTIPLHGFCTAALVEAAVEQETLAIDFNQVLGAGGGAGGAAEFDFH